ncbi:vitellogenin 3, phosvitinless [Aplochiton taeniatus]
MRGFVFFCLVALAEPRLNPQKAYEYKYEGRVNIGRVMPNLAESGVRMTCKVKISGLTAQTFLLQASEFTFEEFNGFAGRNAFTPSPKITERMAAELGKPFVFDYSKGQVGDIQAPAEVSETIVNIVRGILGLIHVTIKTTQRVYQLEEAGIHGTCQSNYAVKEDTNSKDITITQVVDISNCREKALFDSGMALAVPDKISQERGESVISTVKYIYTVKPSPEGGVITRATALERQYFSPFNVKGGSSKMQAMKELVLLGVAEAGASAAPPGSMANRGSLVFKFGSTLATMPTLMKKTDNPTTKIVELIQRLAQANIYQIDSATTEDISEAIHLLRAITYEDLEAMWTQLAENAEHRRWFLDMSVEVGDARILKFLEARFKAGDLSANEAGQTLLLTLNHLAPEAQLVEMAKEFLTIPFSKSHPILWNTVVLAYGSLVYRHCAQIKPCPVTAVQPLLDMASDALTRGSEEDMVRSLKALGNAGHPASVKTIMRFLPGVAATPVELPARVQSAAVQSMRLLAVHDPHSVQDITMSLFVQRDLPTELRMLAIMILFETKPPLALVLTVTHHLMDETDLHVASFAYSLMQAFAKSKSPENHILSTACNVGVKMLAPKFGRLSYRYSKAMRLDWFNDDFLIGTAMEVFMLRSATSIFPTEILMRGKYHFIGRVLQILELGVRADGIKELFDGDIPGFKGDLSYGDFQALFSVLQKWETLPKDKPLLSIHTKAFGQEWFYGDLTREVVDNIRQAFSATAGKDTPVWEMIQALQKGRSWHWTKPFLTIETRYIQATTLGLPLEIGKYYLSVTGITFNAKVGLNPPLTENLAQLLNSVVSVETDGFVGVTKDINLFYGINTEMFQSGLELKSKTVNAIPWNIVAKMDFKQKKFEMEFPACTKETKLASVKNIEEPSLAKSTPIIPDPPANVEQIPEDIYHKRNRMCSENHLYGLALCVEAEVKRCHFFEEYPLYYFMGYTHFAFKLLPVNPINPVEKIRIEIDAGSSPLPASVRQLLNSLRVLSREASRQMSSTSDSSSSSRSHRPRRHAMAEGSNAAPEALFSFKVLAISGNAKPGGYEAAFYYTPAAEMESTQLIVSQVGEEANWKMCTDANIDMAHAETKVHTRWGAECQSYEMSMKAAIAHLPSSRPALKAKLSWTKIPQYMIKWGNSVDEYIPGVAFLFGFYQKHAHNAKNEISTSVTVSSADGIDVNIQLPWV